MRQIENVTNQIMILGGGVDHTAEDNPQLMQTSIERADRAARYYQEHAAAFAGQNAMILCTGGASAIYQGIRDVPKQQAEGTLTANYLIRRWGIPGAIIEVEAESDTSTLNLVNSIEAGYLNPVQYSREHPLAVATHRSHYGRFKADLKDADFSRDATFGIHPDTHDSAVKEMVSRGIRAGFFFGVETGDLGAMRRRSDLVTRVFSLFSR
jgi:hypothetical protein